MRNSTNNLLHTHYMPDTVVAFQCVLMKNKHILTYMEFHSLGGRGERDTINITTITSISV